MKKINLSARYFETNEWVLQIQQYFLIGITDFAQTVFGDIEFITLPSLGQTYSKGETFATTESSKASNDISMPISGEIIAVNSSLPDCPFWLNVDPYDKGWLVKIKATNPAEFEDLMTAIEYRAFIGVFFNKS